MRESDRRFPVHFADAHWIRFYDRGLAGFRLWKIVETMFWKADHNAFTWRVGKNVARGNQYARALAGQPWIHARIRTDDFLIANAKATTNIKQCVFVLRSYVLDIADDSVRPRW